MTSGRNDIKIVTMPLAGYEFRFSDGKILEPSTARGVAANSNESGDIAMHIDPLIALGNAGIQHLKTSQIENITGGRVAMDKEGRGTETGERSCFQQAPACT